MRIRNLNGGKLTFGHPSHTRMTKKAQNTPDIRVKMQIRARIRIRRSRPDPGNEDLLRWIPRPD